MSSGAKLWCFLLLLPFFAAVGHDFYFSYAGPGTKTRLEAFDIDPKGYQGSDLGFVLVNYTPALYEGARSMVGEEDWIKWVDPILRLYTFVVALVPATLFFLWLVISRIFDVWPFGGAATSHADAREKFINSRRGTLQDDPKEKTFRYKRKF